MNEDFTPSRAGRRVAVAVAVALLAHFGLYFFARMRSSATPESAAGKPAASTPTPPAPAPPAEVAVDLRRGSDIKQGQLSFSTELRSAEEQFQPADAPTFDKPAPLPRDRLAFSAGLGDGESGRRGFRIDALLAPVLREIAAVRRSRSAPAVPNASEARAPLLAPPNESDGQLAAIQARTAAAAAEQPVLIERIPPRDTLPPPPSAAPETPAPSDAAVEQFFGTLTSQLMAANQRALAASLKAGPRATVEVRFLVERDGRISNAAPVAPSVSPELDARAVRVVTDASPLPPPPLGLPQSRLQLTFPVQVYR
jgi:protein TonB